MGGRGSGGKSSGSGGAGGGSSAEQGVREAFSAAGGEPGRFITMESLRQQMTGTRAEQDAVLTRMYQDQEINLIPTSNQSSLTESQRAAGVTIGGQNKTRISIELQQQDHEAKGSMTWQQETPPSPSSAT